VGFEISDARFARLDETPLEALETAGRRVEFFARPRAVVTLIVR
jgi:hypothetical protein